MMRFTLKQQEILTIAKEKGFVTFENFNGVFSSPISRKSNIERFIALGVLISENGRFKLNQEKLQELESIQVKEK